jgi:hypothetical protein
LASTPSSPFDVTHQPRALLLQTLTFCMLITPFAIIYPNVLLFPTGSVVSLQGRPSCNLSEFRQPPATPPHKWQHRNHGLGTDYHPLSSAKNNLCLRDLRKSLRFVEVVIGLEGSEWRMKTSPSLSRALAEVASDGLATNCTIFDGGIKLFE